VDDATRLCVLLLILLSGAAQSQPVCTVEGPDSVFFDKATYNTYLPGSFDIRVTVTNPDASAMDSLVIFARSNQRFTIVAPSSKLIADTLRPGDSVRAVFTLIVNPKEISGVDTVIVAVSAKAGVRSSCLKTIWVEKEYRPLNAIICPPDTLVQVSFVDTLNGYVPDPMMLPVTVINHGDAPSKETRIMYVATPGIVPAEGQDPILDVGTLNASGGWVSRVFRLRAVQRDNDTTVMLRFRVQGKGGLGDRIIDTLCSITVAIPPIREVSFEAQCRNNVAIRYDSGRYVPNPFTWSAFVRNSGTALAKNVRAYITLPPSCELDAGELPEILLGTMPVGDERSVTWRLRVKPVETADTGIICVTVLDEFNHTASCCDSIVVPPIRRVRLTARCGVTPDSIGIDAVTGAYQPAEFEVRLAVQNEGTEYADSVVAEVSLSDPDMILLSPTVPRQLVSAKLLPQAFATVAWRIAPLRSATERTVDVTVRLHAAGLGEVVSHCTVHIAASRMPALNCSVATEPADTLHYDPATFIHAPLSVSAVVRNTGTIGARNVQATLVLPSYLTLATGEIPVKSFPSAALAPDSVWTVTWGLLPVRQQNGVYDSIVVEFRGDGVRTECGDGIFVLGIPPLTVLRIPAHFVERYGQRLTAPVYIDNTDRKSIREMDITIRYDSAKVEFLGFNRTQAMLDSSWVFTSLLQPGRIRFTALSPGGYLSGEGTLVNLNFRVLFGLGADQLRVSGTPLSFDSLASSVNRGAVHARFYDGFLWTSGECLWPLTASDKYLVVTAKPNPFNPVTTIRYILPDDGPVLLRVYDSYGRMAVRLMDEYQRAGTHEVRFDGSGLASGVYLVVLEYADAVRTLRLMLIR
jgi:hypothetical protein